MRAVPKRHGENGTRKKRTLSNLQLDRRKEEERLERLQEQLAVIETEKQKLAEREAQISLKSSRTGKARGHGRCY